MLSLQVNLKLNWLSICKLGFSSTLFAFFLLTPRDLNFIYMFTLQYMSSGHRVPWGKTDQMMKTVNCETLNFWARENNRHLHQETERKGFFFYSQNHKSQIWIAMWLKSCNCWNYFCDKELWETSVFDRSILMYKCWWTGCRWNAKQNQNKKNVRAADVTSCHNKQIRGDGPNIVCMEITQTAFKGTLTAIMWVGCLHKEP